MRQQRNNKKEDRLTYNQFIKAPEVRVNFDDGESKVLNTKQAINIAENKGLDLVVINDKANPPVCRIVDKNKYLYEQKQRQKEQAKKARANAVENKEIRMSLNIEKNDIIVKANKIKKMLDKNCKVTITVTLKGRERGRPDLAKALLQSIADEIGVELEGFSTSGNRISARIKG